MNMMPQGYVDEAFTVQNNQSMVPTESHMLPHGDWAEDPMVNGAEEDDDDDEELSAVIFNFNTDISPVKGTTPSTLGLPSGQDSRMFGPDHLLFGGHGLDDTMQQTPEHNTNGGMDSDANTPLDKQNGFSGDLGSMVVETEAVGETLDPNAEPFDLEHILSFIPVDTEVRPFLPTPHPPPAPTTPDPSKWVDSLAASADQNGTTGTKKRKRGQISNDDDDVHSDNTPPPPPPPPPPRKLPPPTYHVVPVFPPKPDVTGYRAIEGDMPDGPYRERTAKYNNDASALLKNWQREKNNVSAQASRLRKANRLIEVGELLAQARAECAFWRGMAMNRGAAEKAWSGLPPSERGEWVALNRMDPRELKEGGAAKQEDEDT